MRITLVLLLCLLPACASTDRAESTHAARDPRAVTLFHSDGSPATWEELVSAAASTDAVLIGENHGHPLGLAAAAALWTDVVAGSPNSALSLEFFERDEQTRLDDYLTGVVNEETFRKRTARTEGNYPPGHREMVEGAKAAKRVVVAANAPRQYVRLARMEGYERLATLKPDQRRLFRVPDELPTGRYREDFEKIMGDGASHGAPAKEPPGPDAEAKKKADLEGAFRSQSLWDWTMADSVATALASGRAPVVHVIGRFHSDFDGGTVLALRRIRPGVRTVVVSFVQKDGEACEKDDIGRADFIAYVGAESKMTTAAAK